MLERVYYNEAVTNDSGLNERLKNKIKKCLTNKNLLDIINKLLRERHTGP